MVKIIEIPEERKSIKVIATKYVHGDFYIITCDQIMLFVDNEYELLAMVLNLYHMWTYVILVPIDVSRVTVYKKQGVES
ncbi:7158_t:CDS:2 [Diversispora eburnea]|uniref:7158_t:CDS:1 n=1 Tax=Diversispora eburnea TaxID=1213867 RepID=A0A9N9ASQ3_9GLOM|nr:7158_t:CDS:2 [Diversispora eburnea]